MKTEHLVNFKSKKECQELIKEVLKDAIKIIRQQEKADREISRLKTESYKVRISRKQIEILRFCANNGITDHSQLVEKYIID